MPDCASNAPAPTAEILDAETLRTGLELGARFHASSPFAGLPFSAEALANMFVHLHNDEDSFLVICDGGLIGGSIVGLYFSPDAKIAQEWFWYAEHPGLGAKLKTAFEQWAMAHGAKHIQFSALVDHREDKMRDRYAADGYAAIEIGFRKAL